MSTSYGITLGQAPPYSSERILQIHGRTLEIRTGIRRLSANHKRQKPQTIKDTKSALD